MAKRWGLVLPLLVLALLLGACSRVADKVAEKVTEKALSEETGGTVDIKDNGISVSGTDASGNDVTAKANIGGTDLPADFPLPLPDKATVTFVTTSESPDGNGMGYLVSVQFPPEGFDDAVSLYEGFLDSHGFETQKTVTDSGGDRNTILIASSDEAEVFISITSYGDYDEASLSWGPAS